MELLDAEINIVKNLVRVVIRKYKSYDIYDILVNVRDILHNDLIESDFEHNYHFTVDKDIIKMGVVDCNNDSIKWIYGWKIN